MGTSIICVNITPIREYMRLPSSRVAGLWKLKMTQIIMCWKHNLFKLAKLCLRYPDWYDISTDYRAAEVDQIDGV